MNPENVPPVRSFIWCRANLCLRPSWIRWNGRRDINTHQSNAKYHYAGRNAILDKDYTVFGQIVKGLDIIDKIATVPTDNADRPVEDVKIIKVRVIK